MKSNANVVLNRSRYRLYREHKYIFFVFSDILQKIARANFSSDEERMTIEAELNNLNLLLSAHAEYEESRIHKILQDKESTLYLKSLDDHHSQKLFFERINEKIHVITSGVLNADDIHFHGYEVYLEVRNFFIENLAHFDYEEKVLMPELQRLLTDDEIRGIDAISYQQMLPEQMVHMMEILFPHMNCNDKLAFLKDIKESEPNKFDIAWRGIAPKIEKHDIEEIMTKLNIIMPSTLVEEKVQLVYPWEAEPDDKAISMMTYNKQG